MQILKTADIVLDIIGVIPLVFDNFTNHTGQQGSVFTRFHPQVDVGALGKVRATRINNDKLHTPLQGPLDPCHGVRLGHGPLMGNYGISTRKKSTFCMLGVKASQWKRAAKQTIVSSHESGRVHR